MEFKIFVMNSHAQGGVLSINIILFASSSHSPRLQLTVFKGQLVPGETVGDESLLEDLLDGGVDIHGPGGGGGARNVISLKRRVTVIMSLALVMDPYLNIRHIEFLDVEWLSGMYNVCVKTVNQTSIIGFFMVR